MRWLSPPPAAIPGERGAAVVGHADAEREHVDRVLVLRIDADLREHPVVGIAERHHVLTPISGVWPLTLRQDRPLLSLRKTSRPG